VKAAPITVDDYRQLAKRRLPRLVFDYLEGGAEDEQGLDYNRAALTAHKFKPRRLIDVATRSQATTLFGKTLPTPLVIAPTGLNGLFWPQGDLVLAKAAERAGIPFILSTASTMSIEEVARHSGGDRWFQLYVVHRDLADSLVERARDADYSTLVLTADVAVNGLRERDLRNGFGLPVRYSLKTLIDGAIHPRWSASLLRVGMPQLANFATADTPGVEAQAALMSRRMDASFDWPDLARLRDRWPGRLLVKGLLDPRDAKRCLDLGVDGVVLSNHGGRQLDAAVSSIDVLAETAALAAPATILVDSGFRRGADVVKALALGADAILLGRATLYGLAARGGVGVDDVIRILMSEIDRTLALVGCASLDDLSPDLLFEDRHRQRG